MTVVGYDPAKLQTEALHWIRYVLGDTRTEQDRQYLEDEEITLALVERGLLATSDPIANRQACYLAAADCAERIAARLSQQSETVIADGAIVKRSAASEYRTLARQLRGKGAGGARPRFADPAPYETTHVAGVDPLPNLD